MILMMLWMIGVMGQQCSVEQFPPVLPIAQDETILINVGRYFTGPNITFNLVNPSEHMRLQKKYAITTQNHNLGKIISIKHAKNLIIMLGVTSTNRYYIYFSFTQQPQNISGIELPSTVTACTDHAISPSSNYVSVTCMINNIYALAHYSFINDKWTIIDSPAFQLSQTRTIQYLTEDTLTLIIEDDQNSYIQLWNIKYMYILNVYDRVFLSLDILTITDSKVEGNYLYILDYNTGIYRLRLQFDQLVLIESVKLSFYTKFAVEDDSVVIAREGGLTQLIHEKLTKYEVTQYQKVSYVIMSELYIVVYRQTGITIYLRGQIEPYLIFTYIGFMLEGTFINTTYLVQYIQQSKMPSLQLQLVTLMEPTLTLSSTTDKVVLLTNYENCNLTFLTETVDRNEQRIFQNKFNLDEGQRIYMNKPGQVTLFMDRYVLGANLSYNAFTFLDTLNTTIDIRKSHSINSTIQGGVVNVEYTYFGGKLMIFQLPTENRMLYLHCRTSFSSIDCEKFHEEKLIRHNHIHKVATINNQTFQMVVDSQHQNIILIRRVEGNRMVEVENITIGSNKYGQHNITAIAIYEEYMYVLTQFTKTIYQYRISEEGINLNTILNQTSFPGQYFSPQQLKLDSRGRLWVKQFSFLLIIEVDELKMWKIQISDDIILSFQYEYQIVHGYLVLLEYRNSLYRCYVDYPLPNQQRYGRKECSLMPNYGMILQEKENKVDDLGRGKVGIILFDLLRRKNYYAVYDLNSLSSGTMYYLECPLYNKINYALFHQTRSVTLLEIDPIQNETKSVKIYLQPQIDIIIPDGNQTDPKQEFVYLRVSIFNEKDFKSHNITLMVANFPDSITKGQLFPYKRNRIQWEDVQYEPYSLPTRGWIHGNVLTYEYSCIDCDQLIQIKDKIWGKQKIKIGGGTATIILQNQQIGILKQNSMYIVSMLRQEYGPIFLLTDQPTDTIKFLKINHNLHLAIGIVRRQDGSQELMLFSFVSFKGFPIRSQMLPSISIINMEYVNNIVTISTSEGVYLYIITSDGLIMNSEFVSGNEVGGQVCWVQLFEGLLQNKYRMLVTLCDVGLMYVSFQIEKNFQQIYIENRQLLDLTADLQKHKINLPNGAHFHRTKTTTNEEKNQFSMLMVLINFHSFEWVLGVNGVNIVSAGIEGMFHRYSGLRADLNVDKTDNFVLIEYTGFYEGNFRYIQAIYDRNDGIKGDSYHNYYIMDSVVSNQSGDGKFISNEELVGLNNGTSLVKYDISNSFRAVFERASTLITQIIFITPITEKKYSEQNNIQIDIYFHGIDSNSIGFWEVFYIVMGCVGGLIVVGLCVLFGRKKYKDRKLVELLEVDEEISSESEDTDNINRSIRNSS